MIHQTMYVIDATKLGAKHVVPRKVTRAAAGKARTATKGFW